MIQPKQILQKREYSTLSILFNTAFAFFIFMIAISITFVKINAKQINDTLYKTTPEIRITADRIENQKAENYLSIFRITPSEVKKINAFQTNELLSKAPGFYIKNYGGAGGMKTVSIRGTNSTQALIMIDGIPINSAQNASIDISTIPASFIKEVEISRGGASNIYGSSSVGGAVNLIFDDFSKGENYHLGYSIADYNEHRINADYKNSDANYSLSFGSEYMNSLGDYTYHYNNFGVETESKRANSNFENFAINLSGKYKFTDSNTISLKAILSTTERGIPDAVVQGVYAASQAKLKEKNAILILSFNNYLLNNDYIKFSTFCKFNESNYNDGDTLTFDKLSRSNFINREFRLTAKSNFDIGEINFNINSEIGFADLKGDMLDYSVGNYVKRANANISLFCEKTYIIKKNNIISISPSVRVDIFSDNTPNYSYLFGVLFKNLNTGFQFKNNISKNFRLPSFNEMYYFNYGTKSLKPENSLSFNSSVSSALFNNINIELSAFIISTNNQIVSVPQSPIRWSAENIGKVVTKGLEFAFTGTLFDVSQNYGINYSLSYTLQSAKDMSNNSTTYNKQIVYTPTEIFALATDFNYSKLTLGLSGDYAGHRFSQPDNSYKSMMGRYFILNIYLAYTFEVFDIETKLRIDCLNLLSEQYAIVKNYPMPERTLRASLQLNL